MVLHHDCYSELQRVGVRGKTIMMLGGSGAQLHIRSYTYMVWPL